MSIVLYTESVAYSSFVDWMGVVFTTLYNINTMLLIVFGIKPIQYLPF